jgi:hypothetical protein
MKSNRNLLKKLESRKKKLENKSKKIKEKKEMRKFGKRCPECHDELFPVA